MLDWLLKPFGYARVETPAQAESGPTVSLFADNERRPGSRISVEGYDEETGLLYLSTVAGERYLGYAAYGTPLPGGGDGEYSKLVAALSVPVPPGTYIQIGALGTPDIEPVTDTYLQRKLGANGVLSRLARQRHAFLQQGTRESQLGNGVLLRKIELIVSVKVPCSLRPTIEEKRVAAEAIRRVFDGLGTVGLRLAYMTPEEYVGVLRRISHIYSRESREPALSPYDLLRDQVFAAGDDIRFERDTVTFHEGTPDEFHAKAMSVKQYPKECEFGIANLLIGDALGSPNQITSPFWLVMSLYYPEQAEKKNWLRQRYAWITQQCFGQTSNLFPLLWEKKRGFDALVDDIDGQGGVVVETNLALWIFDRTVENVERTTSSLRSYMSSIGFEMRADKRILRQLWYETLPMNTSHVGSERSYRNKTLSVRQACWVMPVFGEWQGTRTPTSVFSTRRGEVVGWSLWDSVIGYSAVVFAQTRAGKSFVAQLILGDNLAEQTKGWIVDFGRSYRKLVAAIPGGNEVDFHEESLICMNPFTHVVEIDDEMDVLVAVISTMAAPEHGLDEFRMAALEEAIKAAWSHYGPSATISTVAAHCLQNPDKRIADIGQQLYPFTANGSYGHWFEGDNTLNLDAPVTLLELQSLKSRPVLQKVVFLQLFARIAREMYLSGERRKLLLIDEAHELLDKPVMAKAIEAMYRKVAKNRGAVVLISQGIGDLYNSPSGRAIYANSAWSIVLQQKPESVDAAIKSGEFEMEPYGVHMMKSLHVSPGRYADLMIQGGGHGWGVVRFAADPWMHEMFSSTSEDREEVFALMDRGMGAEDAVDAVMEATHLRRAA